LSYQLPACLFVLISVCHSVQPVCNPHCLSVTFFGLSVTLTVCLSLCSACLPSLSVCTSIQPVLLMSVCHSIQPVCYPRWLFVNLLSLSVPLNVCLLLYSAYLFLPSLSVCRSVQPICNPPCLFVNLFSLSVPLNVWLSLRSTCLLPSLSDCHSFQPVCDHHCLSVSMFSLSVTFTVCVSLCSAFLSPSLSVCHSIQHACSLVVSRQLCLFPQLSLYSFCLFPSMSVCHSVKPVGFPNSLNLYCLSIILSSLLDLFPVSPYYVERMKNIIFLQAGKQFRHSDCQTYGYEDLQYRQLNFFTCIIYRYAKI
jgi:hypothetical protein